MMQKNVGGYVLFMWKVRGELSDWLELIGSLYYLK